MKMALFLQELKRHFLNFYDKIKSNLLKQLGLNVTLTGNGTLRDNKGFEFEVIIFKRFSDIGLVYEIIFVCSSDAPIEYRLLSQTNYILEAKLVEDTCGKDSNDFACIVDLFLKENNLKLFL